jgi:hypothetical protein
MSAPCVTCAHQVSLWFWGGGAKRRQGAIESISRSVSVTHWSSSHAHFKRRQTMLIPLCWHMFSIGLCVMCDLCPPGEPVALGGGFAKKAMSPVLTGMAAASSPALCMTFAQHIRLGGRQGNSCSARPLGPSCSGHAYRNPAETAACGVK